MLPHARLLSRDNVALPARSTCSIIYRRTASLSPADHIAFNFDRPIRLVVWLPGKSRGAYPLPKELQPSLHDPTSNLNILFVWFQRLHQLSGANFVKMRSETFQPHMSLI